MAPLGNLLRLSPLHLDELPSHPKILNLAGKGSDKKPPELAAFIKEVLNQAIEFIDDTMPATFKEANLKASSPSTAQVRLLSRYIPSSQIKQITWSNPNVSRQPPEDILDSGEAWFARRSRHVNQAQEGTASFSEFDYGLRVEHSEHEREYTPDLYDSFKVLEWDIQSECGGLVIDNYSSITMNIYEMCHKLPFPLLPRVFPELVVTANTGPFSFVVVQIPVNISSLPYAFYVRGRNITEADSEIKRKKAVIGLYTSIERCRIAEDQIIEWVMATTSDAKGSLPMWTQKLGVPGSIAKDVGYMMGWISQHRNSPESNNEPGI